MPREAAQVPRRGLRLALLIGALAGGLAGQYWLSIDEVPLLSAAAWAVAAACFIALYAVSPAARVLP